MAAGDLTTLANVRQYLEINDPTDTDANALLTRLITSASDLIQQNVLNRTLASASYIESISGTGRDWYVTANYPITAVASVQINGAPIPAAAGSNDRGFVFDQIAIYLRGYSFAPGIKNIVLQYTAGYASIPPAVEDCCIELVARKFKYRDRIGQVSKILAGETVTFERTDLTPEMKSTLRNYVKVVPN